MGLKREHRESLAHTVQDHEEDLFKLRGEQAGRLCDQANSLLDAETEVLQLKKRLAEVGFMGSCCSSRRGLQRWALWGLVALLDVLFIWVALRSYGDFEES